jgi:uncharacterized protein (DUF433 family)
MARSRDIYFAPAYSVLEASWYLRIPKSTLLSWVVGRNYPVISGTRRFTPVIELPEPGTKRLSFVNLLEAHVIWAIRRKHRISLSAVRDAVQYLREHFNCKHPLIDQQFETDGVNLFIQKLESLINVSHKGQMAMREVLSLHLQRIERDEKGLPIRLYPFTHGDAEETAKGPVVIDPAIGFGRPIVKSLGVRTALIAERYKAGERIADLAVDYGAKSEDIEEAIRSELQIRAA